MQFSLFKGWRKLPFNYSQASNALLLWVVFNISHQTCLLIKNVDCFIL